MRHLATILVSVAIFVAGCGGSVQEPQFAVGIDARPAVLDPGEILAGMELIGGPNGDLQYGTGIFDDDFGVLPTSPDSTEVVVIWSALPCQLEPVAKVTSSR